MTNASRAGALFLAVSALGTGLQGADARDLPGGRGAPAARTGCESFGSDFHKLAGSDTCIRVSGSAEIEAVIRTGSGAGARLVPATGRR